VLTCEGVSGTHCQHWSVTAVWTKHRAGTTAWGPNTWAQRRTHGLPLRQVRTSMGPAYLDCCSSCLSLSTLLVRSPVLQAASLLDILEDTVDQAVSYFAIFELRFAGFCPPRTQMNLGPMSGPTAGLFWGACRRAKGALRGRARREQALFFERNGRVTSDPALQPGAAGSPLGRTAQYSVRICHPVSNSLPLSVV